jgi:hypothetical protein
MDRQGPRPLTVAIVTTLVLGVAIVLVVGGSCAGMGGIFSMLAYTGQQMMEEEQARLRQGLPAAMDEAQAALQEVDALLRSGDMAGARSPVEQAAARFHPYLQLREAPPEVRTTWQALEERRTYVRAPDLVTAEPGAGPNAATTLDAEIEATLAKLAAMGEPMKSGPATAKLRKDLEKRRKALASQVSEEKKLAELTREGEETVQAFCDVLVEYNRRYMAAENDLKASALRTERAQALRKVVADGNVIQWPVTLREMTTTSGGNAVVVLALPCRPFTVGTYNNELSDLLGGDTLIRQGSETYDFFAARKVGDSMLINGSLVPDKRDGFTVTGLTERDVMTAGHFLVRLNRR